MDVPHAGNDVMRCTLQVLMLKPCCSIVSPATVKCSEIPSILPVSDNRWTEIRKFSLSCSSVVNGHECCNVHCVMDQKGSHSHLASALFKSVPCGWFPKDFLTKIHYYVVLYIQATYRARHSFPECIIVMKLGVLDKSFMSISCNKFPIYPSPHRYTRDVEILAPLFLHTISWWIFRPNVPS
jgi:hypothetical protein